MTAKPDTLFERQDDGVWQPGEYARGPFDGLQGGALSALMCATAEAELPNGMEVVAYSAQFLRPCPLAAIAVVTELVRVGGRLALIRVSLSSENKLRATATVAAMGTLHIDALPVLPKESHQPWNGQRRLPPSVHGKAWLMDVMETRLGTDGVPWFKFAVPVTGKESAFARALCPADWLPGITRADSWEQPLVKAAPNVDLSVRAIRPPQGDWIGVRAAGQWSPSGVGIAHGDLLDVNGRFGMVSCTVALIPRNDY